MTAPGEAGGVEPEQVGIADPGRVQEHRLLQMHGWDFWRLTVAGVEQSLAEFRATHGPPSAPP
ncbi:hypothetical protein [Streptomyces sp. NPDC002676]